MCVWEGGQGRGNRDGGGGGGIKTHSIPQDWGAQGPQKSRDPEEGEGEDCAQAWPKAAHAPEQPGMAQLAALDWQGAAQHPLEAGWAGEWARVEGPWCGETSTLGSLVSTL